MFILLVVEDVAVMNVHNTGGCWCCWRWMFIILMVDDVAGNEWSYCWWLMMMLWWIVMLLVSVYVADDWWCCLQNVTGSSSLKLNLLVMSGCSILGLLLWYLDECAWVVWSKQYPRHTLLLFWSILASSYSWSGKSMNVSIKSPKQTASAMCSRVIGCVLPMLGFILLV